MTSTRPTAEPAHEGTASASQIVLEETTAAIARQPGSKNVTISPTLRGAHFVPNQGQWDDESAVYGFRTHGLDVVFRESLLTMHLRREMSAADATHKRTNRSDDSLALAGASLVHDEPTELERLTFEVTFPGSNRVMPRGAKPQPTKFNYFMSDDESKWTSDVSSYGTIIYENLYDGIDLLVMGTDGGVLKYEFHCAPGSDHTQIQVRYIGIDDLRIEKETGDLLIDTSFGTLRDGAPLVWEGDFTLPDERIAEHTIPARFETLDQHTYTFALLTERNPFRPLVIDPEIEWMTYLGGKGEEYSSGIAVDGAGNALVTGWTDSTDFSGANNSNHGGTDAFVLKASPCGQIQWMTHLGGSSGDYGGGIAVDGTGNALVTGYTLSTDFAGANNSYHGGSRNVFALKVSASGQLQWMTYLGGSGHNEFGSGIGVDGAGNALVTGRTDSTDFFGANNSYHGGFDDAFVLKISPTGELEWMTYLGGSDQDGGADLAVDDAGYALVTGDTRSADFAGANNSHHGDVVDAFAAKVSPSGQLQWMTYLGGSSPDFGHGIAVDGTGDALVTGRTNSTDFAGANNSHHGGKRDAFALKVNSSGALQWMTYLGGSDWDTGIGIAVDDAGHALVTGNTQSVDFVGATNSHFGGLYDAFALKVSPLGELEWMHYLGGSEFDSGRDIAVDGAGNALITGWTLSADFTGAINSYHGGYNDAFIVKLGTTPVVPGDLNCDGVVNVLDLLVLLEAWGDCDDPDDCPADLNDDGVVNVLDLLILLENWG